MYVCGVALRILGPDLGGLGRVSYMYSDDALRALQTHVGPVWHCLVSQLGSRGTRRANTVRRDPSGTVAHPRRPAKTMPPISQRTVVEWTVPFAGARTTAVSRGRVDTLYASRVASR